MVRDFRSLSLTIDDGCGPTFLMLCIASMIISLKGNLKSDRGGYNTLLLVVSMRIGHIGHSGIFFFSYDGAAHAISSMEWSYDDQSIGVSKYFNDSKTVNSIILR